MKENWDKYLDPPDEPEAILCESCGIEMTSVCPDGQTHIVSTHFVQRSLLGCIKKWQS